MKEFKRILRLFLMLVLIVAPLSSTRAQHVDLDTKNDYVKAAQLIRQKYEDDSYRLKPSKAGHMGLRLWRNYGKKKYQYLLLQGINYTSNSLDKLVVVGFDQASLMSYATDKNHKCRATTKKKKLRKKTFERFPLYRVMATKILRHVARLDELGLKHEHHDQFMDLLRGYDFHKAFTDSEMIRAWGAQLANQVYWLYNLGIADFRDDFIHAVEQTYPHQNDQDLSKQQYGNKIYTLTHIVIAASEYYRYPIYEERYSPVIDYFRNNIDNILRRCKEDIVIEVGLSLLLVNEDFPEIEVIREHVLDKVDKKKKMIPSENGKSNFAQGEHRNIIAVLLFDWKGCSTVPQQSDIRSLSSNLSQSLSFVENQDQ